MGSKLVILSVIFLTGLHVTAQVVSDKRPNFIIIYTDDQRQDALGASGNPLIITPALDRLTSESIVFTNAHPVFALCSPSRAALLTGRYGTANGVMNLDNSLNDGEKTLAAILMAGGYRTALSGKWHIKQHPDQVGFDFYSFFTGNGPYYNRSIDDMGKKITAEAHCDEYSVDRSIDFLTEAASQEQPFFLFHCTQLPHLNGEFKWDAKQETLEKYNADDMPLPGNRFDDLSTKPDYLKTGYNRKKAKQYGYPDADAIRQHTKEYYAVITEMDKALARLLKSVDELGLHENTYIIFMSDNGWMLGEHGFTSKVLPYAKSTHVPLLIRGPGLTPRTEDAIALNIDIAPTVLGLAGMEVPENIHGSSLLPVLMDRSDELRESFVYEGLGNYMGIRRKPHLAVIGKRYRYIETFADESLREVVFRELYDLKKDPDEMNNLANHKSYNRMIKRFRGLLMQHINEVIKTDMH